MERDESVRKEHDSGVMVVDTSSEKLSYDDNAIGSGLHSHTSFFNFFS